jgi:hypothetical protein
MQDVLKQNFRDLLAKINILRYIKGEYIMFNMILIKLKHRWIKADIYFIVQKVAFLPQEYFNIVFLLEN